MLISPYLIKYTYGTLPFINEINIINNGYKKIIIKMKKIPKTPTQIQRHMRVLCIRRVKL